MTNLNEKVQQEPITCHICGDGTIYARELDLAKHIGKAHPTLAGDKALSSPLTQQPRDSSQRVLGHKPSLDDYDRSIK